LAVIGTPKEIASCAKSACAAASHSVYDASCACSRR